MALLLASGFGLRLSDSDSVSVLSASLWQFVASLPETEGSLLIGKFHAIIKLFSLFCGIFLLLLLSASSAAAASPAAVDILSLYAYNFGQVAGGEQMFLPQVASHPASQSGL